MALNGTYQLSIVVTEYENTTFSRLSCLYSKEFAPAQTDLPRCSQDSWHIYTSNTDTYYTKFHCQMPARRIYSRYSSFWPCFPLGINLTHALDVKISGITRSSLAIDQFTFPIHTSPLLQHWPGLDTMSFLPTAFITQPQSCSAFFLKKCRPTKAVT